VSLFIGLANYLVEDEILKTAVSKYGLTQWARISSLLVRKTPKQCKARWQEWLDPSIKKIEWSRDEDEKLLHMAKLMPTQWRTIAPVVGRTATQCLERYQKLLDDAELTELGLIGPGGETATPTGDDVRRMRPGELDPNPESRGAKPDAIDMDEDEKEMLSEARARLANTQGKKAKRKAREKQVDDSRRMAMLAKRRELKLAGINLKVLNKKKKQMDYDTDIPFEKQPALGFYDTSEEQISNEAERASRDLRELQQAKRQNEERDEQTQKKKKQEKRPNAAAAFAAATSASQIREAEQMSKRRKLELPSPQVSDGELESIVKIGQSGEASRDLLEYAGVDATQGLLESYSSVTTGTPMRTPRAPTSENPLMTQARNLRMMTDTQSSLYGEENTPLRTDGTGYESATPRHHTILTPNPLATPVTTNGNFASSETPRDSLAINTPYTNYSEKQPIVDPRSERALLRSKLAALPKPKNDFQLVFPEDDDENVPDERASVLGGTEDAAERDQRLQMAQIAEEKRQFQRLTRVRQLGLPIPKVIGVAESDFDGVDEISRLVLAESARLIALDASRANDIELPKDEFLQAAKMTMSQSVDGNEALHPSLVDSDFADEFTASSTGLHDSVRSESARVNKLEKKLNLTLGGYRSRARTLVQKINEATNALAQSEVELQTFRHLAIHETDAIPRRTASLTEELEGLRRRERIAQEEFRMLSSQ